MLTIPPLINNTPQRNSKRSFYDTLDFTSKNNTYSQLDKAENIDKLFTQGMMKITEGSNGLTKDEFVSIRKRLEDTEAKIRRLEYEQLQLGRLLDYDKLKKVGFSAARIKNFAREDDEALSNADFFVRKNLELREYMFGYPANMTEDSAMTKHLRKRETELPLMNNCGDPYDAGNYLMDSKDYEKALLDKLFEHFGLDKASKPWGYITTGGSESNKWGIHNGLRKYPHGRVYYSDSAHYSVGKSVKIGFDNSKNDITLIKHSQIPLEENSEKINVNILLNDIRENWKNNNEPAILLLTAGTTKSGAVDDVEFISKQLKTEKIPHYIHLDAALFGGIAKNQSNAPKHCDINKLGIDSISVSLHKYFGNHDVKSVVITKEPPNAPKVDYIGQYDSTTAGSRTFNPFSSLQRITETLDRKMPDNYSKNVKFFEKMLIEHGIKFSRAENSNIFVIDQPSEYVYRKYQLSNFDDNGTQKSHIIVFPSHKQSKLVELVNDLANE